RAAGGRSDVPPGPDCRFDTPDPKRGPRRGTRPDPRDLPRGGQGRLRTAWKLPTRRLRSRFSALKMSGTEQAKKAEGTRFGNYVILERIGRGGMAEVSRAKVIEGPRAGQEVALKRLLPELAKNPQYVDLFCGEADLSRMLVHRNIVRVYEAGSCEDTYYIAMERIDG